MPILILIYSFRNKDSNLLEENHAESHQLIYREVFLLDLFLTICCSRFIFLFVALITNFYFFLIFMFLQCQQFSIISLSFHCVVLLVCNHSLYGGIHRFIVLNTVCIAYISIKTILLKDNTPSYSLLHIFCFQENSWVCVFYLKLIPFLIFCNNFVSAFSYLMGLFST